MATYCTGLRVDPDHVRLARTPFHVVRSQVAPADANQYQATLVAGLPGVMNQVQTGSCTGHSIGGALYTYGNLSGQPLGFVPSPSDLYKGGRALARRPNSDGSLPSLIDDGASPGDVVEFVNSFGVRAMVPIPGQNSDADPATINRELDLGSLERGAVHLRVGDYQIFSLGADIGIQIRQAITNGIPVVCSVPGGSTAWQNYRAGTVLGPTGTEIDHCIFLYAYAIQPDGTWVYKGRNSWGPEWGDSGDFLVSDAGVQEFRDTIAMCAGKKS